MVDYLLRRTSILRHFSLQHFTSAVISLQTFIWHCVPAKTLWINHTVILSASTHLSGRKKGRKWSYFLLPAVISIGIRNRTAGLFITKCILSQRESGFSEPVCTQYVQYIHTVTPSNQTEAAFEWLFLPSQSHCDKLLLVRPHACLLSLSLFDWLTDWLAGSISVPFFVCLPSVSSACLPDCLSTCLHICQSLVLNTPTFFKDPL